MNYIAHRNPENNQEQSLQEHADGVAELASDFIAGFGAREQGVFAGKLHDIGKISKGFQARIRGENITVDHSTAGAIVACEKGDIMSSICIAGHHGGLPDFGDRSDLPQSSTLCGKLKRKVGKDIEDYSSYEKELTIPPTKLSKEILSDSARAFFFTHFLFSCLVDADWLDTEAFFKQAERNLEYAPFAELFEKFESYVATWWDSEDEINKKRCEILRAALDAGTGEKGLFSLTAPTGSGKTAASIGFALPHLLANGMCRIIYVIPYVSILEQTQETFEKIFGAQNVVAHYANVDFGDDETDQRRLATENWDAPIILTTSVQFFESLLSNKPSHCRKLHNIANSVIIFDEAQMLPVDYLKPCTWAISQLVQHFGCSAVLCTATQPALNPIFAKYLQGHCVREICPDVHGMHDFFKRVKFERIGKISNEHLAMKLGEHAQVLCIVNSRKLAYTLFELLDKEDSFYLTTALTPKHRRTVLDEIRGRLDSGKPCRVVATSLIEAGVDVDFPTVFREFAGLDSMIQAAGRCNRNGERPLVESIVYIFEGEEKTPRIFSQNIAAAKNVFRDFQDIASPQSIKNYFELLYFTLRGDAKLDSKSIMEDVEGGTMPFESVAKQFKLIDSEQMTIYIPLDEGEELVRELRDKGPNRDLIRKLGQYSVSVYPEDFMDLYYAGAIEKVAVDAAILLDANLYKDKTGLVLKVTTGLTHFA